MHSQIRYLKTNIDSESLFGKSQQTGLNYVLALDPDRLLAPCYAAMGKKTSAICYGGWESMQIQGHSLGHYLSALSGFAGLCGSEEADRKLDYTINCIKNIQRDDGYFAGIPSDAFDKVFAGEINAERFSLNKWWVPWYSVHKIYAGLIDAYSIGGKKDALEIVCKMADWAVSGLSGINDEQMQLMLNCEHGGMLKVFADLYGITGKKEYLVMAERFVHHEIIKPLIKQADRLQGYHANTQIPKIISLARLYEVTGKEEYRRACEFFFDTVTEHRSYVIGGNSVGEHFGPLDSEKLDKTTTETCNTYNMLELAEHIFEWNKNSRAADYYEKALLNHILASQDPVSGAKTYYVSLLPGFYKVYGSFENSFWCCTGTGMENPSRYNRFIAKQNGNCVYINLFINSIFITENGGKIKIETNFPYEEKCSVKVLETPEKSEELKIRVPYWCESMKADKDGYITLCNSMKKGDEFNVMLPMKIHARRARDKSGNFSILYGPVVLAGDLGNKNITCDIADGNQNMYSNIPALKVGNVIKDPLLAEEWVVPFDKKKLEFKILSDAVEDGKEFVLKPFFELHHTSYTVYFNSKSPVEDEREKLYGSNTIDLVECGRQQSEVDHRYKTTGSTQGYISQVDRSYRVCEENGSFSYRIKFSGIKKNFLVVTTYGQDKGKIKILFDGQELLNGECSGNEKELLYDIKIPLPEKFSEKYTGRKTFSGVLQFVSDELPLMKILEVRTIAE